MKRKFISPMLCLFLTFGIASAPVSAFANQDLLEVNQQKTITGTITDEAGEPLIGVVVKVVGTTLGAVTDFDGNYSVKVPDDVKSLEFSYLGYSPQTIAIGNKSSIDVVMKVDAQSLDDVVVTALGMKRSEKSLGYAMKELKGDELNTNLINPVAALQGKVAGVDISGSDGGMFGSSKVQIRGVSTLGKNNQPIYVIDGMILDNSVKEGNPDWASDPGDFGNELKNLNPDDFASVSVLKGAAATALYGSRGMNGAIVITTKSGKSGQGLGVTFSQSLGFDKVTSAPKLQNSFGPGYRAGSGNNSGDVFNSYNQYQKNADGQFSLVPSIGTSWGPAFDGQTVQNYDGTMTSYKARKNNFKDAYSTGFSSNTNLAVSGGNETTTFYTSLSFRHANGTLPNNQFDRFSFFAKASHKIANRVTIEAGMSFANSMPKNPLRNIGENFVNGTWSRAYDPSYLKDKYRGDYQTGLASSDYGDKYGNVPGRGTWWSLYENSSERKETSVRPTLKLNVDVLDWLKFVAEGSYNYYYVRSQDKQLGSGYDNEGGYYGMSLSTKEQTNVNANFMVNKNFGDWTVNGFLRGEYFENFEQFQSMETNGGLIIPGQYFINNSKQTPRYSALIQGTKKMFSIAFQAGTSWKDQVFVDVTGRNDWSSSLVYADGHGNYSYFYPSINGSWLVSNTFRDKLPDWVTFGKLRASWAQVGNDTSPYSINSAYGVNIYDGPNGNYYGLTTPNTIISPNLKPERKNSWEVGLDWRFFDSRLGVDFTYYKENTKDQIMYIALPGQSGVQNQLINAGNIQNSGIELAVNVVPIRTKDWEWSLDLTYTRNRNKIIELHEEVADYITLAGSLYGNYRIASVAKIGAAYGTLITDNSIQYDEKSGLPMLNWVDTGRGAHYLRNGSEIKEIGSINPDFLGGIGSTLKYKDWSLHIGLDMRFGGYVASYNSRYGRAYGFTETALYGAPGHGGLTWTSKYPGAGVYDDGIIPEGIIAAGTEITMPQGGKYYVKAGSVSSTGETYQELYDKGIIEPTHNSFWNTYNYSWNGEGSNRGIVDESWVKKLNYIALRDISLTYRVPQSFANKIKARNMSLTASGHNLGYLLNSMPNKENPESVSGNAAGEFRVRSFQGVTSSFMFTVNVGF